MRGSTELLRVPPDVLIVPSLRKMGLMLQLKDKRRDRELIFFLKVPRKV